jgi:predicted nucleic acid-binding protein
VDLVVDASVAFKWLAKEDGSDIALRVLHEHNIVAPDLLLAECRNAILTSVRRGNLTIEGAQQLERDLDALEIATIPFRLFLSQAFAIALECRHPIYDCIYVAAAISSDRALVTADAKFAAKIAMSPIARDRIRLLGSFAVST